MTWIAALVVVGLAGFLTGMTGFGFSVLSVPLLLLMMLDSQPLESISYLATGLTLAIGIGAITGWMNSGRRRDG